MCFILGREGRKWFRIFPTINSILRCNQTEEFVIDGRDTRILVASRKSTLFVLFLGGSFELERYYVN